MFFLSNNISDMYQYYMFWISYHLFAVSSLHELTSHTVVSCTGSDNIDSLALPTAVRSNLRDFPLNKAIMQLSLDAPTDSDTENSDGEWSQKTVMGNGRRRYNEDVE